MGGRDDRTGAPEMLSADELTCRLTVGKELASYAAAIHRCLDKCWKRDRAGRTTGSCHAEACALDGVPSEACDARTAACVKRRTASVGGRIECADVPDCVAGGSFEAFIAAVANATGAVDMNAYGYSATRTTPPTTLATTATTTRPR